MLKGICTLCVFSFSFICKCERVIYVSVSCVHLSSYLGLSHLLCVYGYMCVYLICFRVKSIFVVSLVNSLQILQGELYPDNLEEDYQSHDNLSNSWILILSLHQGHTLVIFRYFHRDKFVQLFSFRYMLISSSWF